MRSSGDVQKLRSLLAQRQQEKAELERQVRALQSRVQDEIEPLQEEVLRVQKERLKQAAQARIRSARLRNAYHDAQDAYEHFRQERTRIASPKKGDLQATYRRASKRCHPDAVPDSYREEAAGTFQALSSAYEADHRAAVQAIAEALDQWGFPQHSSPAQEDAKSVEHLRRAVSALETSIERLRDTEAYRSLSDSADPEAVIRAHKEALLQKLRSLQRS